jgi:hypothetical protein
MTFLPLPSGFPYKRGKFLFYFLSVYSVIYHMSQTYKVRHCLPFPFV